MHIFTQQVVTIGRVTPQGVNMLGTGFFISETVVATTKHVVGAQNDGLVILAPHITNINEYQDTTNNKCNLIQAEILEIDPIKDLATLKINGKLPGKLPEIGSFDDLNVTEEIGIFGFPHCVEGRRVLTFQSAEIGAKVLLSSSTIKLKHAIINTQSRPGQSGSLIYSARLHKIIGVLIGAYAPDLGGGISIGGINPRELHQTTHCISAEYLKDMM